MKQLKQKATWLMMAIALVGLVGCDWNSLNQTAEDGTEVSFESVKGSIEFAIPMVEGLAKSTKKARANGSMSEETALKIKGYLLEAYVYIETAQSLVELGDVEGASVEIKSAKMLIKISDELLKKAGIDTTGIQL